MADAEFSFQLLISLGISYFDNFFFFLKTQIKSDGQEISTIECQELKNRFPSLFVHK